MDPAAWDGLRAACMNMFARSPGCPPQFSVTQQGALDFLAALERTVGWLEAARVASTVASVHRGSTYLFVRLTSRGSRLRVLTPRGEANIAASALHKHFPASVEGLSSIQAASLIRKAAVEIAARMPAVLGGLQAQATASATAFASSGESVAAVRSKAERQLAERRLRGVAALKKAIAAYGLRAEDVTQAWNEHTVSGVLKS